MVSHGVNVGPGSASRFLVYASVRWSGCFFILWQRLYHHLPCWESCHHCVATSMLEDTYECSRICCFCALSDIYPRYISAPIELKDIFPVFSAERKTRSSSCANGSKVSATAAPAKHSRTCGVFTHEDTGNCAQGFVSL